MPLAVVVAAGVERLKRWLPAVCVMVVCETGVMSRAMACKGEPDAVGACE